MKDLLKLAALAMAFSGLVACSTAKKQQDDTTVADIETEQALEETNQEGFQPIDSDEDSSLGMGSSGLGH